MRALPRLSTAARTPPKADVVANYALYGSLHGTSMAGPHVAGVVALLLQANPDLTPRQVQVILAATATDRQQSRAATSTSGWGLVDVDRALRAATLAEGESACARSSPASTGRRRCSASG